MNRHSSLKHTSEFGQRFSESSAFCGTNFLKFGQKSQFCWHFSQRQYFWRSRIRHFRLFSSSNFSVKTSSRRKTKATLPFPQLLTFLKIKSDFLLRYSKLLQSQICKHHFYQIFLFFMLIKITWKFMYDNFHLYKVALHCKEVCLTVLNKSRKYCVFQLTFCV